jgi:CheY-like chemotaxis protein
MNVGSGELLIIALDDSDEITHQVVSRHLTDSGLSVVLVTAEQQCLPKVQELHPDLVLYFLSNIHPLLSSSEHIAHLKEAAPEIAIIALASMDAIKLVQPALMRGADDYLITPILDYALLDHLVMKNIRLGRERNKRLI